MSSHGLVSREMGDATSMVLSPHIDNVVEEGSTVMNYRTYFHYASRTLPVYCGTSVIHVCTGTLKHSTTGLLYGVALVIVTSGIMSPEVDSSSCRVGLPPPSRRRRS